MADAQRLRERRLDAKRRRLRRRRSNLVLGACGILLLSVVAAVALYAFASGGSGSDADPTKGVAPSVTATSADAAAQGEGEPGPSRVPDASQTPQPKPTFRVERALRDTRRLAAFGVRLGGSPAERRGAVYIAGRLRATGARIEIRIFRLPNGKTSRNVVGKFAGDTKQVIILGAHMDSKPPSPGANDNASGCAVLLEIARCLGRVPAHPTVKVIFFGTEEMIDQNEDHHHYGSRYYVRTMRARERANVAGMVSVDMVGYGSHFVVRTMGRGPQSMRRLLQRQAGRRGVRMSYMRDYGQWGWSDHEAFELAGIPAAWIEWRDDPVYHTASDTPGHIVAGRVRTAGQFLLDVLYDLDDSGLRRLAR